jgi:hypothetical protein
MVTNSRRLDIHVGGIITIRISSVFKAVEGDGLSYPSYPSSELELGIYI